MTQSPGARARFTTTMLPRETSSVPVVGPSAASTILGGRVLPGKCRHAALERNRHRQPPLRPPAFSATAEPGATVASARRSRCSSPRRRDTLPRPQRACGWTGRGSAASRRRIRFPHPASLGAFPKPEHGGSGIDASPAPVVVTGTGRARGDAERPAGLPALSVRTRATEWVGTWMSKPPSKAPMASASAAPPARASGVTRQAPIGDPSAFTAQPVPATVLTAASVIASNGRSAPPEKRSGPVSLSR